MSGPHSKPKPKGSATPLDEADEAALLDLDDQLRSARNDVDAGRTVTLGATDIERLKNGEWPESLD